MGLFLFFLVIPLLCTHSLNADESKSTILEKEIRHIMFLEAYPKSPLPPSNKATVPPLPQTPSLPPSVPENRGAFNPKTGERYLPSGEGVFNPATGEYYPPSSSGCFNPQTGEYYPRVEQ